jgi:hypothetical protein
MKIYIAGPMRGIKDFNFPAFDAAANHLTKLNFEVVNPAELDRQAGFDGMGTKGDDSEVGQDTLREMVRRDFIALTTCDGIYLLKGWQHSRGARAEYAIAELLGMVVWHEEHDLK